MDIRPVQQKIDAAAQILQAMGNKRRLLILCELAGGERRAGDLAGGVGLSQSALSQHLAKLRRSGIVRARRASRAMFYSIANPVAEQVMAALVRALACKAAPQDGATAGPDRQRTALPSKPNRSIRHVD
jgi:ArsR family transcriptional regulator